jgi:hypothetical protein
MKFKADELFDALNRFKTEAFPYNANQEGSEVDIQVVEEDIQGGKLFDGVVFSCSREQEGKSYEPAHTVTCTMELFPTSEGLSGKIVKSKSFDLKPKKAEETETP